MSDSEDLFPVQKPELEIPAVGVGAYRIAMIIDGVVHQVFHFGAKDASRYLSNPVFIQIPRSTYVEVGDTWDGKNFIPRK